MITEQDLQEAIAECEGQRNPTSNTCIKLAAYYAIKDKLYPEEVAIPANVGYSYASAPVQTMNTAIQGNVDYESETEFSKIVRNMDMKDLFPILDELMSTIEIISPKLYAGVMRKLSEV